MITIPDIKNSTSGNQNNIEFSNIFNIEEIQNLQDLFADVHGVASLIVTPDGQPITKPSNFTNLCSNIIRKTGIGLTNCFKSDVVIGKYNSAGPILKPCLSCGLWDAGASISVGGQHIASWLVGQVRNEEVDQDRMIGYADEIGANRDSFIEAMKEVPVMSVEKFKKVSKMLFAFANELSEKAYNNYQLKIQIAERERVAEALRESEGRYQSIISASPDNVTITDLGGRVQMFSPVGLKILGYDGEENMLGRLITDFIVPVDRERADANMALMFQGIMTGPGEYIGLRADGSTIDLEANAEFILDAEGKPSKMVFIVRDISDRKRSEKALLLSEERMNYAQEIAQMGSWDYNVITKEFTCSENFGRMLGLQPNETGITKDYFEGIIHPEDKHLTDDMLRKVYENKEPVSFNLRIIMPDGEIRWVKDDIIPICESGVLSALKGVIIDITTIKKAKETIDQQNDVLLKLNQFSIELASLSSGDDLEAFITKRIKDFTGASMVLTSLYNYQNRTLTPKHIEMEPGLLQKVIGFLGKQLEKFHAVISDEMHEMLIRDFIGHYHTLSEATFGTISPKVGEIVQSFIKVDRFIGVAYLSEGEIYGTSLIALIKHQPDPSIEMLKHFIFLAAVSLRRKRAEEKLQLSEQTYRGILDSITEAVYVEDKNGVFLDVNLAAEKMYGYSKDEIVGRTPEFLAAPGKNDISKVKTCLEKSLKGKPQSFEFWGQRKDGTSFPKDINTSPGNYFGEKVNVTVARDITLRKQSEEKITMLAHAIRNIGESVCIADLNDKILFVNSAFLKTYQYEEQELIGNLIDMIRSTSNSINVMQEILPATLNGGWQGELLNRRKDGSEFLAFVSTSVIYDENGKPIATTSITTDITGRKQTEIALKESEDKYRTMIEYSNDLIWTLDTNGNFTFFNEITSKTTGLQLKEWKGKSFLPLVLSEDLPIVMAVFNNTLKGEACNYELRFKKTEGSILSISVNTSPIYISGKIEGVVSFGRDNTEGKKSEKQLKLLSKAIEQSPVTVIITNKAGNIEYANPKFSEVTGYSFDEVRGKNPRFLKSGQQPVEFYKSLWNTILSGNDWYGELHNKKKNGDSFWESAAISSINNDQGDISFFIAVKEDITDRKKLLEDLIKAKEHAEESDRLKSAFLANMSHEIRTPMNGILGFAKLLNEPNLTGGEQQEYIQIIEKSGARMLNIINDIMSISKVESGQMEIAISETNINEQIEYLYTFFKPEVETKGLKIFTEKPLSEKDAVIKTDKEKVYAILTNLIKNAIKFTHSGSIEFGYRHCREKAYDGDMVNHVPAPAELEFFVKDSGMGIDSEQKDFIFDRFRQGSESLSRNYEGAGLGLAISKAYVEILGGRIWVESKKGEGSVFYFTIPYDGEWNEKGVINNTISMNTTSTQVRDLKILIAEDDEGSAMLIALSVRSFSKEIIKVRTGFEAVEACRNNPDIDLVLMDIKMPEMDGFEAAKQIRQFNTDVIIIAQTAYALTGDRERTILSGCNDYISKPIQKDQFMVLMQKYFKK